jgi:hypothetical protein
MTSNRRNALAPRSLSAFGARPTSHEPLSINLRHEDEQIGLSVHHTSLGLGHSTFGVTLPYLRAQPFGGCHDELTGESE